MQSAYTQMEINGEINICLTGVSIPYTPFLVKFLAVRLLRGLCENPGLCEGIITLHKVILSWQHINLLCLDWGEIAGEEQGW